MHVDHAAASIPRYLRLVRFCRHGTFVQSRSLVPVNKMDNSVTSLSVLDTVCFETLV